MDKKRILLAGQNSDPDPDLKAALVELGYDTATTACRGDEAVRVASELNPDLVLMDLSSPGQTSSLETAAAVWKACRIPIVFVAGQERIDLAGIANVVEPYGYLVKPFNPITLQNILEAAFYKSEMDLRLRESEERLRYHYDHSPLAIIEWKSDFIVTRWTGAAERIFGWTAAETVGRTITELQIIYEEDMPIVQATMQQLTDGLSQHVVSANRNRTKEGRIISCEWYNSVRLNHRGEMLSVLSEVLDVTARNKVQRDLEQSLARLDLAQYVTNFGVWDWDMVTGSIDWSEQMFRMLGLDPDRHRASFEDWEGVLHPEDRELAGRRIEQAIQQQSKLDSDYRILLPDGQVRWINAVGTATYDGSGRAVRMLGICIDITDRRKMEDGR